MFGVKGRPRQFFRRYEARLGTKPDVFNHNVTTICSLSRPPWPNVQHGHDVCTCTCIKEAAASLRNQTPAEVFTVYVHNITGDTQ